MTGLGVKALDNDKLSSKRTLLLQEIKLDD